MTVALAGDCPRSRLLLAGCDPKVSGQLYHAREFLRAAFSERELWQSGLTARCTVKALTTALIDGSDHGKVHTVPWRGSRFSTGTATRISARWYVFKLGDEKKFFPVVLTTGPEEILCSGRVGSRAPIRGPLPLLGSATGSQGSLLLDLRDL
jgi:hypothetical protein